MALGIFNNKLEDDMSGRVRPLYRPKDYDLANSKTNTIGQTKSFMLKHVKDKHPNQVASYSAKVTATANDCLTRQVREAVHLRRSEVLTLNSKTEWHQPGLFRFQHEIFRG